MSIKAIQTVYKGYKFRSRLEARWAVFFDALGLDWEYEPEGYELPDGTWYLPDFYIHNDNTFIEIKSDSSFIPSMVIRDAYLAGKIKSDKDYGFDNWREAVADKGYLGNKHEFHSAFYSEHQSSILFRHDFAYRGPFFSDNHGGYIEHKRALKQIANCDVFFAWINSSDAFGSFAEIGFAHAKGKKIYIGYDKSINHKDMWFLSEMADNHGAFDCPRVAFDSLVKRNKPSCDEESKVSQFSLMMENKSTVMLCLGDPVNNKVFSYYGGSCYETSIFSKFAYSGRVADAATKARQARFEHGETPQ